VTQKLYLEDPTLSRFEATVVGSARVGDREAVVLDRTAFYPEGGGQPADRGTLAGVRIVDVVERDGQVLHVLDGASPPEGAGVEGHVDGARRLDHVQQHHGQHLLSAAFERLLGAATLSFHLGAETCTIDLDAPPARVDVAALAAAEAEANALVWRDLPVEARERTPEELAALPLRKDAVKGGRVVVVRDEHGGVVDASPCGGTHPARTGVVGAVAVLGAQKWGAGTRVEFVCGGRVPAMLRQARERLAQASAALRCAPPELPAAVEKLSAEGAARRKELERLVEAVAAAEAERLHAAAAPGAPVAARIEGVLGTAAALRAAAQALAARGRVALLGTVEGERAHLCFARPKGAGPHLGEALREAVAVLGGKGGGSPDLAQGGGPDVARLEDALAAASARVQAG
jgi:alanyl-tRNA synthetase